MSTLCDHETPEIWYSCIRDLFRKILEKNLEILSKNEYITICEKFYKGDKVSAQPTNYIIYCNVCDSLVFISGGNYSAYLYYDNHLKRCIFENIILNEYARNKIFKFIDKRKFQI
ncbi:hypothetical protein RhiirC2_795718 [Rhizophagus irregularis]|uniref:Uncharacterized protein n=1 Tax=Rhizophagus irregularis TaxID=588596 RepID=A0A2N1MB02_9GLOM|nr:hypothetical protein RhiirC2_795718 [Rhizophagus irregularis]